MKISLLILSILFSNLSWGQTLLFDGDFESGIFQGWTPGGENGGFATLAAKGTCYSGNDTTAISFNGDLRNNYAALLRSNAQGDTGSIAKLRSANFNAGSGILFHALSETLDPNDKAPSELLVRILDSGGKALAELPVQTAVVHLSPGCPSVKRDATFSVHYIDTHQYEGDISIEFLQHTNRANLGYFTLIDNVINVPKGQVVVHQSQPKAVAGISITDSGTLFLDPRASIDPDNLPNPLEFSWFINSDETILLPDMPCINLNNDFELPTGNHTATLYVTDGVNYSADTLRFAVPQTTTSTTTSSDTSSGTTNSNITLTTPKGDRIISGQTLSDPDNQCNIDVARTLQNSADLRTDSTNSSTTLLDIDSTTTAIFSNTFDISNGTAVNITSSNVDIQSATGQSIGSLQVSITTNRDDNDALDATSTSVTSLAVSGTGTSSITISPVNADSLVSDADYETVLEALVFDYSVNSGETANTATRTISYSITDSDGNGRSATVTSRMNVQE